jgi:3-deoxy-D-manno-octulosonic-acid transferase
MIGNGGMFSVNDAETLKKKIDYLMESKENIERLGNLNSSFIKNKIGATQSILANLK